MASVRRNRLSQALWTTLLIGLGCVGCSAQVSFLSDPTWQSKPTVQPAAKSAGRIRRRWRGRGCSKDRPPRCRPPGPPRRPWSAERPSRSRRRRTPLGAPSLISPGTINPLRRGWCSRRTRSRTSRMRIRPLCPCRRGPRPPACRFPSMSPGRRTPRQTPRRTCRCPRRRPRPRCRPTSSSRPTCCSSTASASFRSRPTASSRSTCCSSPCPAALPDQPIGGPYTVTPEGTVNLGFGYGAFRVAGMTLEQAADTPSRPACV